LRDFDVYSLVLSLYIYSLSRSHSLGEEMKSDANVVVVRVLLIRHARTNHNALGIIQGQLDTDVNEEGNFQIQRLGETLLSSSPSSSSSLKMKKSCSEREENENEDDGSNDNNNNNKNKNNNNNNFITIRKVLSSDLRRCSHTARGMVTAMEKAKNAKVEIEESPKLRERHVGALQGCPRKLAPQKFPREWAIFCESKKNRSLKCAGEGGESVDDVLKRVKECIDDAVRRSVLEVEDNDRMDEEETTIAVVTHAGVLLLLREYLVDEDLSGEENRGIVRNCSIGTMRVEVNISSDSKKMRWILESWGVIDAEGTADVV